MSAKSRWLTTLLIVLFLLGFGLASASAGPAAGASKPPSRPVVGSEIIISDFNNKEILPDVAYNHKHNEYLAVWHTTGTADTRTIRGARISASGQLLDNFQINGHATKDSMQPAVAYDPLNDRYLVVFAFDGAGNGSNVDLLGRFIPWDGPSPGQKSFPIATWNTNQWTPDVAYGRAVEEFLVVWANEYQAGTLPMYVSGRRIRADNGNFPGGDSDLTISHLSQNRVNPAVTYNLARNEYLVVYDNGVDILGTRYTGDVNHNFGGEFPIAGWPDAESVPDVAACHAADRYLVTWQSKQGGTNNAIYGRFVSGAGTPEVVQQIDDTTGSEIAAAVSCDNAGRRYLVAWQTEYASSTFGIWARFVQPDGPMSPSFLVQHPTNTENRLHPAVAGGGANFLVAWEHERGANYTDIHGRVIAPYANLIPVTYRK